MGSLEMSGSQVYRMNLESLETHTISWLHICDSLIDCVCNFFGSSLLDQLVGKKKEKQNWQRPTLPGSCPPSTIGASGLNYWVRDGNQVYPRCSNHQYLLLFFIEIRNKNKSLMRSKLCFTMLGVVQRPTTFCSLQIRADPSLTKSGGVLTHPTSYRLTLTQRVVHHKSFNQNA